MQNNQKGFIAPILLAIIALLVIGGGAYIYQNKKVEVSVPIDVETQQINQIGQQTNIQTSPVNTQTNNLNWKTYINNQYGFEFSYPKDWEINVQSSRIGLNSSENQKVLEQADKEIKAGKRLEGVPDNISIIIDNKSLFNQTLEQYVQKNKNSGFRNPEKIFISDLPAYKGFLDGLFTGDSILFEHSGYLFNIVATNESVGMNKELTNKILSTFKFTK